VIVVRYADDFVIRFENRAEAEACLEALRAGFAKFGLKLHDGKTRLIEFGRYAASNRKRRGEKRPETFDFLGFTHKCASRRSDGSYTIHRHTIAKRMRATLQAIRLKLRKRMHLPPGEVGRWLRRVVQGWLFDVIDLHGLVQELWPVHCVRNTGGGLFAPKLETRRIAKVFPKGTDALIDSYSGFFDNGHRGDTGLAAWLGEQGVTELTLCGLALDYCVKFTALDALACGFKVNLHLPACCGVELQVGDCETAVTGMRERGVLIVE